MSESPIRLRGKSGGVVFDGTQSPGGGSQPVTREQITGNVVSIANNASADMTWDAKANGSDLLDLTDPANPTVIEAGVYAVLVDTNYAEAGTVGGFYFLNVTVDADGDPQGPAVFGTSPLAAANLQEPSVVLTITYYLPAGARLNANIFSRDGATRDFAMSAVLQRLSGPEA